MNDIPIVNLKAVKGRTFELIVGVDNYGSDYVLKDGEKLIFGVKQNSESSEYLIKKELTSADRTDGGYALMLSPEEMDLPAIDYFYDIALKMADGSMYQVIDCSHFEVTRSVVDWSE